jgi:RNA processing factor Prp31
VRNSPRSIRGKVASTLASKISLAARTDYITEKDKGDELKSSLDAAMKHLRREAS